MEDQGRALAQRFLDKVAADLAFRQQLLDDPGAALEQAGFRDAIQEGRSGGGGSEVSGYRMAEWECSPRWFTCMMENSSHWC